MIGNIPFLNRIGHQLGQLGSRDTAQKMAHAPKIDWEAVYGEQLPKVYNFFRYRINDDALAQDMTAATFEKAWRARDRYRSDVAGFSTWLFSIARNVANDHFRQAQSNATPPVASLDALGEVASASFTDDIAQHRADLRQLGHLLAQLDERERELLALKFGAGLTNRAIASVMSLSESNVGTIANRLIERLRKSWSA
ncbi:MAG: sigma-70 family RNA polymerase sigma factor [Anaerolineae bacterium]|nr:sigma-70 family RNA polymerase sigma factor [Anaerolineae bacterium]